MGRTASSGKPRNSKLKGARIATRGGHPSSRPARIRLPDGGAKPTSVHAAPVRKLPRQQRSKQMVEAVLQAAAEVFAELGYARATTNKIAERAGVSVGSLYQYFGNKDALLAHLLEQHHTEVHRVVDAALTKLTNPEVPLEDGLRQLLSELVGLHQANPAVTKALSAEVLRQSAAAADLRKDESHRAEARRVGVLLKTRSDVREGDHTAMAAVVGQTTAQLSRWLVHDAPPGMDQAALLEETVQLLLRYLAK